MKNKKAIAAIAIILGLAVCGQCGCSSGSPAKDNTEDSSNVQIANPWHEITEDEAKQIIPRLFKVPAGAENVEWSVMESDTGSLVQLSFVLNGEVYTARAQVTGDATADISGMHYEWTQSTDITLANWGDGQMKGKYYRYIGEDEWADLCTWYDEQSQVSYSLSVASRNLDGFDLQGIAEAL